MSANEKVSEKPSERAARALRAAQKLVFSTTEFMANDPIESAAIIARETSCDSLAEENQRLRGVLEEITQFPDGNLSPAARAMREIAVEALKAKSDKAFSPAG